MPRSRRQHRRKCPIGEHQFTMIAFAGLITVAAMPFIFFLLWMGLYRHNMYSLRDLLPPLHLEENSPLRRSVMWRADGKCGESYPVRVKGLGGNDIFVPAGCNPRGASPAALNCMNCGPVSFGTAGRKAASTTWRMTRLNLQLLMLSQV